MRIGFHVSIQGGFLKAAQRAKALGCETLQLFCQNPRGWSFSKEDQIDIDKFRSFVNEHKIYPVSVHTPYLANLCSSDENIYLKSIDMLKENLRKTALLGAEYLIIHPGNMGKNSEQRALEQISKSINTVFNEDKADVMLLLENTAGQGTDIGFRFEHLQSIIDLLKNPGRIGICLDTAHAFEAGYDVSTRKGLEKILKEFKSVIGLEKLKVLHLNDSKTPCGARVDRHAHIGKGCIGMEGFRHILNHQFLTHLPAIMETPKNEPDDDLMNMKTVRALLKKKSA